SLARLRAAHVGFDHAARIAAVHAVARDAGELSLAMILRHEQALILVRGEARRAVAPEAEREIDAVEPALAHDGRGVAREIFTGREGIAAREDLQDALARIGQALAVTVSADLYAGDLIEAARIDDRGIAALRVVEVVAAERARVLLCVLGGGSVAGF